MVRATRASVHRVGGTATQGELGPAHAQKKSRVPGARASGGGLRRGKGPQPITRQEERLQEKSVV